MESIMDYFTKKRGTSTFVLLQIKQAILNVRNAKNLLLKLMKPLMITKFLKLIVFDTLREYVQVVFIGLVGYGLTMDKIR
jgi:hypothetical protein